MIDIIIINFNSYWLLHNQLRHWLDYMKGDFRLVVVDNTPDTPDRPWKPFYGIGGKPIPRVPGTYAGQFDGISSGLAYDYAISLCETDIIGMVDPDAFFFNPNILEDIEKDFAAGYKCVGAAGFYPDFQSIFDKANPTHRGELAPVLWTQFMTRELAASESFVCNPPGVGQITGWKIRERIIDENIPCKVWPGFYPFEDDYCTTAFGPEDKPISCHLLKGCSSRSHMMPQAVPRALEWGKRFYQ